MGVFVKVTKLGCKTKKLDLDSGATLADAIKESEFKTANQEIRVNNKQVDDTTVLQNGDVITLVPPIKGGAGKIDKEAASYSYRQIGQGKTIGDKGFRIMLEKKNRIIGVEVEGEGELHCMDVGEIANILLAKYHESKGVTTPREYGLEFEGAEAKGLDHRVLN